MQDDTALKELERACDNKYTDTYIHMIFNLKQNNKLDAAKKILDKICDDCYVCVKKHF